MKNSIMTAILITASLYVAYKIGKREAYRDINDKLDIAKAALKTKATQKTEEN